MRVKKYDVTQEMVDKLKEGQTFKNFTELSNYLGVLNSKGKPLGGKSRDYFLAELNRYVELQKADSGYTITVARVRPEDEILPPRPEGGNNKFSLTIQNMIAYHLLRECEGHDWIELFWSPYNVMSTCGMVNPRFYTYVEGLIDNEETLESEMDNFSLEVTDENKESFKADAISFRQNAKKIMSDYIITALSAMARNHEITFDNLSVVFIQNNPKKCIIPSEDAMAIYLKMYTNVIESFTTSSGRKCKSLQDIFFIGKMKEFYDKLNEMFAENFPYDAARPMYHIVTEPTSLKRTAERTEYALYKQNYRKMNADMCKNLQQCKTAKRGKTLYKPNPDYAKDKTQPRYIYEYEELSDKIVQYFIGQMVYQAPSNRVPYVNFEWSNTQKKAE